jgi:hypothetical protein
VTVVPVAGGHGPPYLIRSYTVPPGEVLPTPRLYPWTVIDAALATTANPVLFPPHSITHQDSTYFYQDASLSGYSNPSVLAHKEATRLFPDKKLNVFLSVGPGQRALIRKDDESRIYAVLDHMKEVATDAEKPHEDLFETLNDLYVQC